VGLPWARPLEAHRVAKRRQRAGIIGKLADAWAPQIADQYLLDNVLAAEGIAKRILREEMGAACFNAHAHILLGRTKFCQPGYGAAHGRRRDQDGHESGLPHDTGRTERAPSAGLPGCVCSCTAAGPSLESGPPEGGGGGGGGAGAIKKTETFSLDPDRANSKTLALAAPCVPPRMFSCSCRSARKLIEKMHALDEGARGAKSTCIANELVAAALFLIAFTHPNLCVPTLLARRCDSARTSRR
jgi:hypothetical protein